MNTTLTTKDATQDVHAPMELAQLLSQDHRRLERLFDDVLAAFRADARLEAAALWSQFERELEAHFHLEESRVLPVLATVNRAEAEGLRREHDELRAQIDELGTGVDLHLTRADAVEKLIRRLEDHAHRENHLLYEWLGQQTHAV